VQNSHAKNSILIFLPAKNFSEEEYLIVKKVFEKTGKTLFVTSDSNNICSGDKGLKVSADINLFNVNEINFAALVLIGGKGIKEYRDNNLIQRIAKNFNKAGKVVSAICSAPIILANAGLLTSVSATCRSEDRNELISIGINYKDTNVVNEGNIITANGPLSAELFAETILNMIK
jgi:protease I